MNIRRTFIKLSEADKGKLSFMKNPWEAGKQAGTSTFYSDGKSAHLAFVDSSGQSHVLQDQEILGTQTSQRTTIDGVVRYAASYNWYRSRNDQGKVYRSVEDNGMIFYADA